MDETSGPGGEPSGETVDWQYARRTAALALAAKYGVGRCPKMGSFGLEEMAYPNTAKGCTRPQNCHLTVLLMRDLKRASLEEKLRMHLEILLAASLARCNLTASSATQINQ